MASRRRARGDVAPGRGKEEAAAGTSRRGGGGARGRRTMAARRTAGRIRGDAAVLCEKIEDEETRRRLGRGGGGRRALPFIGQGTFSQGSCP